MEEASVIEKLQSVMRSDENHITIRMVSAKVDGCKSRERPKKI